MWGNTQSWLLTKIIKIVLREYPILYCSDLNIHVSSVKVARLYFTRSFNFSFTWNWHCRHKTICIFENKTLITISALFEFCADLYNICVQIQCKIICNFLKMITPSDTLSQQKTIHCLSKYLDVKINILVHRSLCIFHHDKKKHLITIHFILYQLYISRGPILFMVCL